MIGAIIGDIVGSTYEIHNVKTKDFSLFSSESQFTDDTVLTLAVAEKLLADNNGTVREKSERSYAMWYRQYYRRYPNAAYGQMFKEWANADSFYIQRSYGNGGAMKVVPIGYACNKISDVMDEAKRSCYYTHHNGEAIKYARAVALCVFLAHHKCDKNEIKKTVCKKMRIHLDFTLDEIRDTYMFDSRSKESVPQAIVAFLEGTDYESTIRNAISIGGDSDTIACIAGGIAEAYYKEIPEDILSKVSRYMEGSMNTTVKDFNERFHVYS